MNDNLPANKLVKAAIKNDNITAGPAESLATFPAKTYTPTPNVLPIPNAVKSKVDNTLASLDSATFSALKIFFLVRIFKNIICV